MTTNERPFAAAPPEGPGNARERLAFNYGPGTVPGRRAIDAAIAAGPEQTFATAAYAEPRDWGYAGLLAFTAVLLARPQDLIPALEPLHLAEVCAIIGIAPMILHRIAHRQPVFRITPETLGIAFFGLVIVATAPFSIWPGGAIGVFTDSYLKAAIVFVLMLNTLTTPKRLEQVTWLILLCCGYIAIRVVFDYARGVHLVEGNRAVYAGGGLFGNPNDLALNMVTFMPAALIVALMPRQTAIRRLAAATIAALMLATVVFTKSRGGALGLVAMLTAMLFLGRKIRPGFTAMALGVILLTTPFMPSTFWTRMASIVDPKADAELTGSGEMRRIVMMDGIHTFVEWPLTGVGAGQFKNYNPPTRSVEQRWRETHNALIQAAAETGIFGLLAFAFLIVRGGMAASKARQLLAHPRKRNAPDPLRLVMSDDDRSALYSYSAGMTAGLVGWFVCSQFSSVAYSWTFYYLLALIVAARELTIVRLSAAQSLTDGRRMSAAVRPATFSPHRAPGFA
jgi:putative inorganic carbon (HCO3(-)) transporter